MKIAILHNYLDNIGGAEKLTLMLAQELNADIYTTNINEKNIKKMGFSTKNIHTIGKVPKKPPFKQELAKIKFKKLKLKGYDAHIITGDWAGSATTKNECLWYTHSPLNEIWKFYEYTRENIVPKHKRWLFDIWVKYNRKASKKYAKQAKKIITNSQNTKKNVKKYLQQEATIINPPIDTKKYRKGKKREYWLSVNRLIKHKKIEEQLKTFKELPNKKLIIVGPYEDTQHFLEYKKELEKIKPKNVTFKHHVKDEELIKLYENCTGLITTSKNEDFGMNVIEAYAAGKPVVAVAKGGYLETVKHKKTGILTKPNTKNYKKAIEEIEKNYEYYTKNAYNERKKYTLKTFTKKIKKELEKTKKNKVNT